MAVEDVELNDGLSTGQMLKSVHCDRTGPRKLTPVPSIADVGS
jgi:hypothetical protein